MFFFVLDSKGEIIWVSDSLISFLGYKKEECIKLLKRQINPFYQNRITTEKQIITKGEIKIVRENGKEELMFLDIIIGQKKGEIANTIFILSPTEERLDIKTIDAIINNWAEGIILEREGVVILVNQKMAELIGGERRELVGRNWGEFLIGQEEKGVLESSENKTFAVNLRRKNGTNLNMMVNFCPLFWQEKPFAHLIIVQERESNHPEILNRAFILQRKKLLQLTEELEKANKELLRLNEAKSEFVSAVSHDLRTPLTTIIEGIRLCEDGTLGEINPEQRKFLKLALEEARRLADFINDLLDLSRVESGRISVKKKKLRGEEIIQRVLNPFKKVIENKDITLSVSLPEELPSVFADEAHLYRILNNLIGNAIKFTPNGGKIEITANFHPEKEEVVFGVKDTGIGIPKKEQGKIFQRFCRIERSGGPREPGTGLGLALCQELVGINDGKIWFKSEENKGTEFYFSLPVYSEILELKDTLKWAEEQTKRTNLPLALFLIEPLSEQPLNLSEEIEKILQKENAASGFYRWLILKDEAVIFLIAPSEKAYDNYLILRDFLKKEFPLPPLVSYQIFLPKDVNREEILKIVLKKEKV
ncbi:MAG: ATP-binding protein [candidate division WOR-3 bacterium]